MKNLLILITALLSISGFAQESMESTLEASRKNIISPVTMNGIGFYAFQSSFRMSEEKLNQKTDEVMAKATQICQLLNNGMAVDYSIQGPAREDGISKAVYVLKDGHPVLAKAVLTPAVFSSITCIES